MTDNTPTREQTIADNIEMRKQEIMMYQLDIDNYTRILAEEDFDDDDPDVHEGLQAHKEHIKKLLTATKLEQRKSKMILAALEKQQGE